MVVGKHNHRRRRIPKSIGNVGGESVVVKENGIECLVEKLRRQWAFEIIEPEVKKFQIRNPHNHLRKIANKSVVAKVELVKQSHPREARWDDSAESVGVDVE